MICYHCQVTWSPRDGRRCWVCGGPGDWHYEPVSADLSRHPMILDAAVPLPWVGRGHED